MTERGAILRFASRAQELAIRARRADLLDAARFVGALAANEVGNDAEARRLFIDYFASTKARGALGLRGTSVSHRIGWLINELDGRGKTEAAINFSLAVRDASRDLGFDDTYNFHRRVTMALESAGRMEDALDANEVLATELANNADPIPAQRRERTIRTIKQNAAMLRLRMGDESGLAHIMNNSEEGDYKEVVAGYTRGDLEPARQYLKTHSDGEALAIVSIACAARAREMAAIAPTLANLFKQQLREPGADVTKLRTGIDAFTAQLMECGAAMREPALVDAGRAIIKLFDEPGDYEDALAAEGRGDMADAAKRGVALTQRMVSTIDERGSIEKSTRAGWMLERAALAYLSMRPPRIEEAVATLNEARARDLRASRANRDATKVSPPQGELARVERAVAAATLRLQALARLTSSADRASSTTLAAARAAVQKELERSLGDRDRIARDLSTKDPSVFRAAALAPALSVRDIQARLASDEVLVYYLLARVTSMAVVVDRTSAKVIVLPALDRDRLPILRTELLGYRASLAARSGDRGIVRVADTGPPPAAAAEAVRADLYQRLVKPLESVIARGKRVIIVPEEYTVGVAFAELGPPGQPWIERNPIRVIPGTYLLEKSGRIKAPKERALVLGDPEFGNAAAQQGARSAEGELWPPLPGTRTEAIAVGRLLGATPTLGTDASEAMVKKHVGQATVVHLATHGMADPLRPSAAVVVLAKPTGSRSEDGFLHAFEIERMKLSARLVVLSACETGKGQSRGTEGTLALDRAFLVAGATTVVSSLWVVPDEATAALMTTFYVEFAKGSPADVALAVAMNTIRKDPRWADPSNWSAFRVIGGADR